VKVNGNWVVTYDQENVSNTVTELGLNFYSAKLTCSATSAVSKTSCASSSYNRIKTKL